MLRYDRVSQGDLVILKTRLTRQLILFLFSMLIVPGLRAQQTSPLAPPAQQTQPPEAPRQKSEEEKQLEQKEQSQRILGVLPQFGVTSRQNASPLTAGEKFHLFAKASFDPVTLSLVGFQAAISQAEGEFSGYGQGAAGYGKRYGASLADEVSSGFFSNYFYSTLLKEDPRYFRRGEGSIKRRLFYSLAQEFVCRTDKGSRSINWQNIFGAFTACSISNAYYPASDRGFGLTMSRSGIALLYGSAGGLADEFWPDVSRRLFHRHQQPAQSPQDPTTKQGGQ